MAETESPPAYERARVRAEFDVAVEELSSPQARALRAAGVLQIFDPGERLVGVRLDVDPGNPEAMEALGASRRADAVEALPRMTVQLESQLEAIRSAMLLQD